MSEKSHGSMNAGLANLISKQAPSTLFEESSKETKPGKSKASSSSTVESPSERHSLESNLANKPKSADSNEKSSGPFRRAALDHDGLREAALTYLDRYDASQEQVRRVLKRRIFKHGSDEFVKATALELSEIVLKELCTARLLDDHRFALNFTRSGRARGYSLKKIRFKLAERGLERSLIDEATLSLENAERDQRTNDEPYGELAAAITHVRKKRLLRKYDIKDRDQKNKALANLARQGFSFDIAQRALEFSDQESASTRQ